MRNRQIIVLISFFALQLFLMPGRNAEAQAALSPKENTTKSSVPSRSFRGIELGMDRDMVISSLKKDPIFAYRGPEDLSLLPSPNQSLIEVSGVSFVRRGYFQFYEGQLWVMILALDADKIDHYSVYTSLVKKYGEPSLIDPKETRWENKVTRLALERPLTLRYMDMTSYNKLSEEAGAKESVQELDRQGFLSGL
jgi:hypothetical protein